MKSDAELLGPTPSILYYSYVADLVFSSFREKPLDGKLSNVVIRHNDYVIVAADMQSCVMPKIGLVRA